MGNNFQNPLWNSLFC